MVHTLARELGGASRVACFFASLVSLDVLGDLPSTS